MADPILGRAQVAPYDIMAEQERLKRKRKLVEALQLQSMQGNKPTFDTGRYLVPNFMDPVGQIADRFEAARKEKELAGEEKAATGEMQKQTQAGIQDLVQSLSGTPQQTPNMGLHGMTGKLDEQDMGYETKMGPPTDMIGGITRAYASQIPGLKELGHDLLKAQIAKKMAAGDMPGVIELLKIAHLSTASVLEANRDQDINKLRAKGDVKIVDGKPVNVTPLEEGTGPPVVGPYVGAKFGKPERDQYTGLPTQEDLDSGKVGGTTGATSPIQPAQGAMELYKGAFSDYQKELSKGKEAAVTALERMPALQDAFGLIDNAVMGAPWSEIELKVRQAAKALGWSDDKAGKISSTQAFMATVSSDAMDTLKALRPASNLDLEYAQKLTGGSPVTDPRTAKILVSLALKHSMNSVLGHQANVGRMDEMAGMVGLQDSSPLKKIYNMSYGGEGTAFHDPKKYGLSFDEPTKKFKADLTAAGGAEPKDKPLGTLTPEEHKSLMQELEERRKRSAKGK